MSSGAISFWVENPASDTDEDAPQELELTVEYTLTPGYPASRDDPGAGPDIDLDRIVVKQTGVEFQISAAQREDIEEAVGEDYERHHGQEDPDDARDRDRDDQMLGVGRYAPYNDSLDW